jgi:hypothetical protein
MNNTKAQERHTECLQQMQDMKAVIDAAPLDISPMCYFIACIN